MNIENGLKPELNVSRIPPLDNNMPDEVLQTILQSEALRWTLIFLNFLITIIGLSGNIFVLYCSRVHHALKVDKVTVLFLESLAISDIVVSVCLYFTTGVKLAAKHWVFGSGLCYVTNIATISSTFNETLVIAFLSVYRTWMLKKPPGVRSLINIKYMYLLAVGFQCIGCVFLVVVKHSTGEAESDLFFDWYNGSCVNTLFTNRNKNFTVYTIVTTFIFIITPLAITLFTTSYILNTFMGYDCRTKRNKRAFRVVKLLLFILIAFILSYAMTVISCIYSLVHEPPRWMEISIFYFVAINVFCNPFIYVIISPYFRGYLKEKCGQTNLKRDPTKREKELRKIDSDKHSTARHSEEFVECQNIVE